MSDLRFNLYEKSIFMGFILSILCSFVNFQSKCDKIKDDVFRLHVIANSDSDKDQTVKLRVRDAILRELKIQKLSNLEDTKKFVCDNIDVLGKIAKDEVESSGSNCDVSLEVCRSNFSNREYENLILPAGYYDSLKIKIGEGRGKNWWCVLFPPMCVGVAKDKVETDGFSESESEIVENKDKYEVEFKIVEVVNRIHSFFRRAS